MKNLSMFKKLVVGFCAVFMMAAAVGSFGLFGMKMINDADDKLYNFNLLAVDATGSIIGNYANQRSVNRDFVLYDSASEQFKSAETTMKNLESEMETYIANYTATIEEASDAAQFKNFTDSYYGDFQNLKAEIYQLSAANEQEQAQILLNTTGVQIANKITDILVECHTYNIQLAKEAVDNNKTTFKCQGVNDE